MGGKPWWKGGPGPPKRPQPTPRRDGGDPREVERKGAPPPPCSAGGGLRLKGAAGAGARRGGNPRGPMGRGREGVRFLGPWGRRWGAQPPGQKNGGPGFLGRGSAGGRGTEVPPPPGPRGPSGAGRLAVFPLGGEGAPLGPPGPRPRAPGGEGRGVGAPAPPAGPPSRPNTISGWGLDWPGGGGPTPWGSAPGGSPV